MSHRDRPAKQSASSAVQENAVQENAVQENAVQENPVQENAVQENAVQENSNPETLVATKHGNKNGWQAFDGAVHVKGIWTWQSGFCVLCLLTGLAAIR
ncbi:hypothetical protein SAMN06265222_106284 [Neorhodopirellula lusitana]|uniref:Uncharacterized protein n=1 Tax=Neorhodopirellula lusitana TaxID=445327 RepID=A0ABY1Q514_9BACT|nr:hypothetical protein [Neorhodopirellula lusitana]SMP59892.1 hypothetical protein SAMN06265222_106284 [Neorhodopirellula lusitana]